MLSSLILVSAPAAKTFAKSQVRFVHAVPGADPVSVTVGDARLGEGIGFGEVSGYSHVANGRGELRATGEGGKEVASAQVTLDNGVRYTAVALGSGREPEIRLYRDGGARGSTARLRTIHAAPELGEPDVKFGSKVVARKLGFRDASPYTTVTPATADISATRAGVQEPLVSRSDVALTAGTASTAVLAGTGGERAEVIVLTDASAGPRRAPQTGLGGLSDGSDRWLAALLAALAAGTLGGAAYRVATSRGRAR